MRRSFLLILFFIPQILFCDVLKPEISKDSTYIGEEFIVKADIPAAKEMSAKFLKETKDAAIRSVERSEKDGKTQIRLITLTNGNITVPEIELTLDGVVHKVEPFSINSMNRTQENDTNLRDLKETVKIYEKDYTLLYVLIGLLTAIALILIFLKLRKKFKKKIEMMPEKIDPSEVAAKMIKEAKEKRETGDNEAFVDITTFGIRTYMWLKNGVNYKEMTTSEVRRKLRKDKMFSIFSEKIIDILKLGDRFKFADDPLSENDLDKLIDGFVEIVKEVETQKVKENDAA